MQHVSTRPIVGALVLLLILTGVWFVYDRSSERTEESGRGIIMKLSSTSFSHNGSIPAQFTCDGEDVNPPLAFEDVPQGAKSLALIIHDPDAPRKEGWTHWILWNIEPESEGILQHSVPQDATEGITDFGSPGYGGPCPPSGTHHYNFTLYALDVTLSLSPQAKKSNLEGAMKDHILAETTLTGLYSRE